MNTLSGEIHCKRVAIDFLLIYVLFETTNVSKCAYTILSRSFTLVRVRPMLTRSRPKENQNSGDARAPSAQLLPTLIACLVTLS